ncbi:uncharacterized protein LOC105422120 isoform X1 [Pogonomyrmex barbatus]|uniref:Uncharacterized protein LOC105422120 isoform X1 n=1 Tax=Pogonomyrmex barbatus TaxID=144034 RepID=A0A8N1S4E6_9HYME|nr:uncharacterized protein LOC105422120 isoform X1 [Pogonomyrmex barbatus]
MMTITRDKERKQQRATRPGPLLESRRLREIVNNRGFLRDGRWKKIDVYSLRCFRRDYAIVYPSAREFRLFNLDDARDVVNGGAPSYRKRTKIMPSTTIFFFFRSVTESSILTIFHCERVNMVEDARRILIGAILHEWQCSNEVEINVN